MEHGQKRSLSLLEERIAAIPDALEQALAIDLDSIAAPAPAPRRWLATGTGASEGPARILVQELSRAGLCARFEPLSAFVGRLPEGPSPVAAGDGLVVFSQGLSPNARLALGHAQRASFCLLVSAVAPSAADNPESAAGEVARLLHDGGQLLRHGPADEGGLLVRVVGPAVASLLAVRLASVLGAALLELGAVPAAVRQAAGRLPRFAFDEPLETIALIHAGGGEACAHGLRWKLLECLALGDPPSWDVLQLVHGPVQQFYERPLTLLGLEHPGQRELFDRLAAVLPPLHRLIRLHASLPAPLGWFEHDAQIHALVLAQLRRAPRDLMDWPGKGSDAPLYLLGAHRRPQAVW